MAFNRRLKARELGPGVDTLDTTGRPAEESAADVAAWIRARLAPQR